VDLAGRADAGVVDEDVQAAELGQVIGEEPLDLLLRAYVDLGHECPLAMRAHRIGGRFGAIAVRAVCHRHVGAGLGERGGDALPDA
jgi:hypothetical protein